MLSQKIIFESRFEDGEGLNEQSVVSIDEEVVQLKDEGNEMAVI